ncbi:MAG: D-tyrosyl-tRNA(Tyr) deacylase [Eubacterium sp.]|nr:D-tyrosyl-tRNA(Tyr) deacylase [Eubacterium sp.]
MKLVVQVVSEAKVDIAGETVGKIGKGFLVLIGIGREDTEEIADKMIDKLIKLRIFDDENGKTNLALADVDGGLLLVSQFTLYANCKKGNRPSFTEAGEPQMSEKLYEYICEKCAERVPVTEKGVFGADMKVSLVNEGPFTVVLDSDEILGTRS